MKRERLLENFTVLLECTVVTLNKNGHNTGTQQVYLPESPCVLFSVTLGIKTAKDA